MSEQGRSLPSAGVRVGLDGGGGDEGGKSKQDQSCTLPKFITEESELIKGVWTEVLLSATSSLLAIGRELGGAPSSSGDPTWRLNSKRVSPFATVVDFRTADTCLFVGVGEGGMPSSPSSPNNRRGSSLEAVFALEGVGVKRDEKSAESSADFFVDFNGVDGGVLRAEGRRGEV